jgi:hypothetical protein
MALRMILVRVSVVLIGVSVVFAPSLATAPPEHPIRQGTPRCDDPAFRQFDFWIGEWEVSGAKGALVGSNRITSILDGCALREEYEGVSGYRGTSYNSYDRGRRQWHQTWVDNRGLLLRMDGEFDGKRMVLIGMRLDEKRNTVWDRTAWETLPGGRVRQLWDHATSPKGPWTVVFDGTYRRKTMPQ